MPNKLSVYNYITYCAHNRIDNDRGREIRHVDTTKSDRLPQPALKQKS